MLDALADLAVAIVTAIVEFMVLLLNIVFSAGWVSAHGRGLTRVFYGLITLSALHLFVAMMLAVTGAAGPYLLSILFNRWVMVISLALLVTGVCGAIAVGRVTDGPGTHSGIITYLASYGLVIAILLGAASIWTTQTERRSLTERLCEAGAERVSEAVKDPGNKALDLAERLLHRDLREKLPCNKVPVD